MERTEKAGFCFVSYDALFVMMQLVRHDQRYNQSLFDPIDSVLPYCGGKLQNIKISPDRMGGGCTITAQCSRCHTHTNYSTSRNITCPDKIQRTEIGTRIALASFLSSSTPTQTIRFLNLVGVPHYSMKRFDVINQEISKQIKVNSILFFFLFFLFFSWRK